MLHKKDKRRVEKLTKLAFIQAGIPITHVGTSPTTESYPTPAISTGGLISLDWPAGLDDAYSDDLAEVAQRYATLHATTRERVQRIVVGMGGRNLSFREVDGLTMWPQLHSLPGYWHGEQQYREAMRYFRPLNPQELAAYRAANDGAFPWPEEAFVPTRFAGLGMSIGFELPHDSPLFQPSSWHFTPASAPLATPA